jgi:HD-GYP domain-containing protein (c-di-GMP phosphodiesterase class II)
MVSASGDAMSTAQFHELGLPGETPHYLRAVTAMGDKRDVIVSADIYASNGIKLLAKGARIDSLQYERLTRHRLSAPLDNMLSTERPVDASYLALEVDKLIESDAVYRRIVTRAGDPRLLKHYLCGLKLPTPVQVRLTVMLEQHQEMFQHSLRTAMIAFSLLQRMRLPALHYEPALLAALCHDFGEMHTAPWILDPKHSITAEERRYVHVHPITGYVLLHEMPGFPAAAAQAVLQHHERLDGSGYPHALAADRIGLLGQAVGVADVAEAVIRRFDLPRVDMLFRINHARFDRTMLDALRDLLHVTASDPFSAPDEAKIVMQLENLADLLHAWPLLREMLEQQIVPRDGSATPLDFLFERMSTIRSLMYQAGLDEDNLDNLLALAHDDPVLLQELHAMVDEMDWLLRDLANEIDRRSPELIGLQQGALKDLLEQLQHAAPDPER